MIKNIFKEARKDLIKIKLLFKKAVVVLAFRRLKRKAMRLHRKHNCQVFVVKVNGKISVISKYQFKEMRQRGYIRKSLDAEGLRKIALFVTPKRHDKK